MFFSINRVSSLTRWTQQTTRTSEPITHYGSPLTCTRVCTRLGRRSVSFARVVYTTCMSIDTRNPVRLFAFNSVGVSIKSDIRTRTYHSFHIVVIDFLQKKKYTCFSVGNNHVPWKNLSFSARAPRVFVFFFFCPHAQATFYNSSGNE